MKITNSKYLFYLGVVVFHCQYAHVLSEDDFSLGKDKLINLKLMGFFYLTQRPGHFFRNSKVNLTKIIGIDGFGLQPRV